MPQAVITEESPRRPPYQRHSPEQTHLYQIVNQHYSEFRDVMAAQGKPLPMHVQQGFSEYLKCGQRVKKAGFTRKRAQTGAMTLIQRFGSALNLNLHFYGAHPCAPPCGRPAVV
jgi:hypothetical protein